MKLASVLFAFLSLCACWLSDEQSGPPSQKPLKPQSLPAGADARDKPGRDSAKKPSKGLVGNWHDARPGDWVQFLNIHGGIVVFTVLSVDESGVDMRVENYTPGGKLESSDRRRVDTTEYFVPRRTDRFSPVEVEFELPAGGRTLNCDRYLVVTRERGEIAETLMCPEVRAGGIVFIRRSISTYYVLLDFGDSKRKPELEWDSRIVKELRERYDRPFGEDVPLQEDPPEGEPPEPPED